MSQGLVGTVELYKTSQDAESNITLGWDYSDCHEIVAGQKITSAVCRCLLNDQVSTDLTLGTELIDSTGAIVNVPVGSIAGAVVGRKYTVTCVPVLNGSPAEHLLRWIDATIAGP